MSGLPGPLASGITPMEAEGPIERQWMLSPTCHLIERPRESRVEVDAAERGLTGEVVAAYERRSRES